MTTTAHRAEHRAAGPGPSLARLLDSGRAFDYDYQGAYYGGGPYPSYFWRLPYACGVYGYC